MKYPADSAALLTVMPARCRRNNDDVVGVRRRRKGEADGGNFRGAEGVRRRLSGARCLGCVIYTVG
jgi:hypothetical protein